MYCTSSKKFTSLLNYRGPDAGMMHKADDTIATTQQGINYIMITRYRYLCYAFVKTLFHNIKYPSYEFLLNCLSIIVDAPKSELLIAQMEKRYLPGYRNSLLCFSQSAFIIQFFQICICPLTSWIFFIVDAPNSQLLTAAVEIQLWSICFQSNRSWKVS